MPNVYVVTEGEYSDYHICAVFDNRKAAEEYCALGHGEFVEEYELNTTSNASDPVDYVYCFHVDGIGDVDDPKYILRSDIEFYKERFQRWRY